MMNFPVELTLRTTGQGLRMFAEPVREIESIHGRQHLWKDLRLTEGDNPLAGVAGDLFDIGAEFAVDEANRIITTPAYMDGKSIKEVHGGIAKMVARLVEMVGQSASAVV